jgi:hypothetical protein
MSFVHKIKRRIQKKIINNVRKRRETRLEKFLKEKRSTAKYSFIKKRMINKSFKSGNKESYNKFSNDFCESFESKIIKGKKYDFKIGIGNGHFESIQTLQLRRSGEPFSKYEKNAWISLGFEKNTLIIESMQTDKLSKTILNNFRRTTKKQALNYLIEEAEKHAKKRGLTQVKIRKPQTLGWYQDPYVPELLPNSKMPNEREIRANMRILYRRVAKRQGYLEEEFYYTKKL